MKILSLSIIKSSKNQILNNCNFREKKEMSMIGVSYYIIQIIEYRNYMVVELIIIDEFKLRE